MSNHTIYRMARSCMQDAEMVIDWIQAELDIKPGETTSDGRFSFELTNQFLQGFILVVHRCCPL